MGRKVYRNKGSKDNVIISLSGAHGVGKSTIFSLLKKKFEDNLKFKFYPERYVEKPPFPFGSTDKQVAFRSEIHFLQQLIRRNQSITNYDERYNGRILILDRTPLCVLVYSKSLYLKEKDYNLILDTYNSIEWKEDYIIYLTAKPKTIMKRILKRGSLDPKRREWNEEQREYLLEILSYYKMFLLTPEDMQDKVIVIKTDGLSPREVRHEVEKVITKITGYSPEKIKKHPPTQTRLNFFT
ncbi:MAG: deoxynucleoside kinase [Promethearchaeia archaeon]